MAPNSLYPGFVKLFYTSAASLHTQTLPCKPFVAVGGEWWLESKAGGAGNSWKIFVDNYAAVMRTFFPAVSTITFAELWTLATPTAVPVFQDTHQLNVVGTNGTAVVPMSQIVTTFRTQAGGRLKIQYMDVSFNPNAEIQPPFTGALLALSNYLTQGTGWVCGRNGGFPIQAIRALTKTNDHLRKKRVLEN